MPRETIVVDGITLTRDQVERASRDINIPEPEFIKGTIYRLEGVEDHNWMYLGTVSELRGTILGFKSDKAVVVRMPSPDLSTAPGTVALAEWSNDHVAVDYEEQ